MTILYQDDFEAATINSVPAGWTSANGASYSVQTAASVGVTPIGGTKVFTGGNSNVAMYRTGDTVRGNQGTRLASRVRLTGTQAMVGILLRSNANFSSKTEYELYPEFDSTGIRWTLYKVVAGSSAGPLLVTGYFPCADGDILHQKAFALDGTSGSCDIKLYLSVNGNAPTLFMSFNDTTPIATGVTGFVRYGAFVEQPIDNYVSTDGAGGEDVFYPVDTTAPTVASAAVANGTPTVVNLTMSEPMNTSFVPAASAFTVSGHTVSSVAIIGSTINLTVSAAFVNGEAARTVAYTQPGTNNARDVAGNLLANFTGQAITNNVAAADTTPPTFSSAQVANAAPANIVITMSETLAAFTPAASAFAVSGGKTVSSVARSGATITLTCSAAYAFGDTITVTYTKPGTNMLQDAAGNQTASFGPSSVTNNIASGGGTTVTITSPSAGGKRTADGTYRAGVACNVTALDKTTHAVLERKTGLTSPTSGPFSFTSTVLTAGTERLFLVKADADDKDLGAFFATPV